MMRRIVRTWQVRWGMRSVAACTCYALWMLGGHYLGRMGSQS